MTKLLAPKPFTFAFRSDLQWLIKNRFWYVISLKWKGETILYNRTARGLQRISLCEGCCDWRSISLVFSSFLLPTCTWTAWLCFPAHIHAGTSRLLLAPPELSQSKCSSSWPSWWPLVSSLQFIDILENPQVGTVVLQGWCAHIPSCALVVAAHTLHLLGSPSRVISWGVSVPAFGRAEPTWGLFLRTVFMWAVTCLGCVRKSLLIQKVWWPVSSVRSKINGWFWLKASRQVDQILCWNSPVRGFL